MIRIVRRFPSVSRPAGTTSDRRRKDRPPSPGRGRPPHQMRLLPSAWPGRPAPENAALSGQPDISEDSLRGLRLRHLYLLIRQASLATLLECGQRTPVRRDRRHAMSHAVSIAIYLAHVVARMSMHELAAITGRHRTSIGHVIALVEDRRDDAAYDGLVDLIEQRIKVLLPESGEDDHG